MNKLLLTAIFIKKKDRLLRRSCELIEYQGIGNTAYPALL